MILGNLRHLAGRGPHPEVPLLWERYQHDSITSKETGCRAGLACWSSWLVSGAEAQPYMAFGLKAAGVAALALTLWTLRWAIKRHVDSRSEDEQVRGTLLQLLRARDGREGLHQATMGRIHTDN